MKNYLKSAVAGLALLGLAGCATGGDCSSDPVCVAQQGVTAGYAGESLLAELAKANHDTGALTGDNYAKVKALVDDAKKYLDIAYAATSVADINSNLAKANADIAQGNSIVKGN